MSTVALSSLCRSIPSGDLAPAVSRPERAQLTEELLARTARASPEERQRLLDEVVVLNIGVANAVASRYRSRGIPSDDLQQVAYVALVKAAQGFDPSAGHHFLAYCVPTIRGEIKRYFRDHGWAVRPPRRIQELQSRISTAQVELSYTLGRSPRASEVAEHLDESFEDVSEALASDGCFTPLSLDRPAGRESATSVGDLLGEEDSGRAAAEARIVLAPVLRRLAERDRRILLLRFVQGWTQQEIAQDIGVTQMQVSRLLSRILSDLRAGLSEGASGRGPAAEPSGQEGAQARPVRASAATRRSRTSNR
jgi:RNA polymerase sigma-B factor